MRVRGSCVSVFFGNRCAGTQVCHGSDSLRDHLYRAARALRDVDAAAPAVVQIEGVAVALVDLQHRVVGAYAVAVIAAEAVAAARAPARLEQRVGLLQTLGYLVEARPASEHPVGAAGRERKTMGRASRRPSAA